MDPYSFYPPGGENLWEKTENIQGKWKKIVILSFYFTILNTGKCGQTTFFITFEPSFFFVYFNTS